MVKAEKSYKVTDLQVIELRGIMMNGLHTSWEPTPDTFHCTTTAGGASSSYLPVIVSSCPQWKKINSDWKSEVFPNRCVLPQEMMSCPKAQAYIHFLVEAGKVLGLTAGTKEAGRDLQESAMQTLSSSSPWQKQQNIISTLTPVITTLLNLNGPIYKILSA